MEVSHRSSLEDQDVEVWLLPSDEQGRVELPDLLDCLGKQEITSLLVEGGGRVLASFFERRLVDKVLAFIGPLIIGGQRAPTPVSGSGAFRLAEAVFLEGVEVEQVGEDALVVGYPRTDEPETAG
jgi:diaminohydroxyphosphoribosylaminopyrimidine deaminase/5-amino-6-(5-phosphoribosylamino)uracil reductase